LPKSETNKSVLLSGYLSVAWSNGCVHLQYFLPPDPSAGGHMFDPPPPYACFLHWVWTLFNGWSNNVQPWLYGWTNSIWNRRLTVDYGLFKLTSHPTVHRGSMRPNASHYWCWTEQNLKSDFHWEANCLDKPNRDLSKFNLHSSTTGLLLLQYYPSEYRLYEKYCCLR
jgi:hypothetical protein